MDKDKLHEAMNEIESKYLEEAVSAKKHRRPYWVGAVAAVLAVAILAGFWPRGSAPIQNPEPPVLSAPSAPQAPVRSVHLSAAPKYPTLAAYPTDTDDQAGYTAWLESQSAQHSQPEGYADSLADFFTRSTAEFLSGEGNRAYSPVNLYMALAMLAETSGGESRQEILELLGADSIEALRTQVSQVWNAHYNADGRTTSLLANAVWLDDAFRFYSGTAELLAEQYYAAMYHGDLGSEEMNALLRQWLNAQTGGLLQEQTANTYLPEETVFALASTVCFSADWGKPFGEASTADAVFHAPKQDILTAFMNRTGMMYYYRGTNFGAVSLALSGNNAMWLILPDEGTSTADVLESGEYMTMLSAYSSWKDRTYAEVQLSLPRFDISSQADLVDGMKKLGVTQVFDRDAADLTGLVDLSGMEGNVFVNKIDHAVRVAIDEEGVTAAAYTVISTMYSSLPMPQERMEFTLDRPFLFVVSSPDNLPLFAGVVSQP